MNSKWHFWTSIVKSGIRIGGCLLGLSGNFGGFIGAFLAAEILGVVEELGDRR